ncbi:carboxymuconolactone decarboxylase family protein [Halioxenophilus aromaticivorans]|uniref:Carboxymuconolactone decarboxylase family protein n=1 Tax=Halioxenophilus aromaticivorans TaxID=1306992 RepID=A0AAV3TW95_9ALTE
MSAKNNKHDKTTQTSETSKIPIVQPENWQGEALEGLNAFPKATNFVLTQHRSGSGDNRGLNLLGALAHYPTFAKAFLTFNNHVASNESLSVKERELIILRTAWLRKSEYEYVQHVVLAQRVGIGPTEFNAIQGGDYRAAFDDKESLLLTAVDEMVAETRISRATYQKLAEHYSVHQIMDIVGCYACYETIAVLCNSFDIPIDPGVEGLDQETLARLHGS